MQNKINNDDDDKSLNVKADYFEKTAPLKNQLNVSEFSGIPSLDRELVKARALEIYESLVKWCEKYSILALKNRFAATCVGCVAMSPKAEAETILKSSIISIILFALDDVTDGAIGKTPTTTELIYLAHTFSSIVASQGHKDAKSFPQLYDNVGWLQVSDALAGFCKELDSNSVYYPFLTKRFTLAMQSMLVEADWWLNFSQKGVLPTYEDYSVNGSESINAAIVMAVMLILLGEQPIEAYDEALLDSFVLACGGLFV